jgi:hypothetical protein
MEIRFYILSARVLYKTASRLYRLADWLGEGWTSPLQKPVDLVAQRLSSWSAVLLMKGYWMIQNTDDWEQ